MGLVKHSVLPLLFIVAALSAAGDTPDKPLANIVADRIDLVSAGPDQLVFHVETHVISPKKVAVKRVIFEFMQANGIPLDLTPLEQRFDLIPNVPITLPTLTVTVSTHDIRSLEPLIAALRDGRVSVTGQAHLELELTFLGRLFSGHPSGKADIDLAGDIPFDVPGGPPARDAMMLALKALQLVIGALSAVTSRAIF